MRLLLFFKLFEFPIRALFSQVRCDFTILHQTGLMLFPAKGCTAASVTNTQQKSNQNEQSTLSHATVYTRGLVNARTSLAASPRQVVPKIKAQIKVQLRVHSSEFLVCFSSLMTCKKKSVPSPPPSDSKAAAFSLVGELVM